MLKYSKKRIIFFIPSLVGGGAERVLSHLVNYLDRDKYDILLVLFENTQDYGINLGSDTNTICLNKKSRWDFFKLIFKIKKIMYNYNPNAVISFLNYANILVILANLFCKMKFNVLISERNYPSEYLSKARLRYLKKWLTMFTYRRANKIIAVSKSINRRLVEDYGVESERVKTIYNPLLLKQIKVKSQEKVEHPFFRDEDAQVIIGVGRLAEQKRFDNLLKAFSLVRKEQDKACLIILGKGELQAKLENLALDLKISNWIDFVGFKPNPYAWIAKANIFVLSSDDEGFPNVLLEAMACGTPVISTDCPSGPNEIIANGKNGVLVPTGNEKALAKAIITLLKDGNLRKKYSMESKKKAEDFRIDKILSQYERLF